MVSTVVLVVLLFAIPADALTAKDLIIQKFYAYVSDFFTPQQVSDILTIAVDDVRDGKDGTFILKELKIYLRAALTRSQSKALIKGYKGSLTDLGLGDGIRMPERVFGALAYAMNPTIQQVRRYYGHEEIVMYYLLTPESVQELIDFLRSVLTPQEWDSIVRRFGHIVKLHLYTGNRQ